MSTFSGSPAVSGDDGFDGTGYDNSNVQIEFGDIGTANMRTFVRFPNVTIAQGSTISAATVQFTARFDNSETTCNANIYFQNADNPSAPTDSAGMDTAFGAATSAVAWNDVPAWTAGDALSAEKTPDLSSILQTVVNRGGFASGNAVLLLIQNNASSTNARRRPRTVDSGSGLAVLDVTYSAAAAAKFRRQGISRTGSRG